MPCTTSSQETEWVYSYNPGARTGLKFRVMLGLNPWTSQLDYE